MGSWGRRHTAVSRALSIRAQLLEEGGPRLWAAMMKELRVVHLGARSSGGRSVLARLQAAGLPLKRVHTVLVTHSHPDHYGGAGRMVEESGATVVTHTDWHTWDSPIHRCDDPDHEHDDEAEATVAGPPW